MSTPRHCEPCAEGASGEATQKEKQLDCRVTAFLAMTAIAMTIRCYNRAMLSWFIHQVVPAIHVVVIGHVAPTGHWSIARLPEPHSAIMGGLSHLDLHRFTVAIGWGILYGCAISLLMGRSR